MIEKKIMRCYRCNGIIEGEYHCDLYDEPPFYCSEECYGNS